MGIRTITFTAAQASSQFGWRSTTGFDIVGSYTSGNKNISTGYVEGFIYNSTSQALYFYYTDPRTSTMSLDAFISYIKDKIQYVEVFGHKIYMNTITGLSFFKSGDLTWVALIKNLAVNPVTPGISYQAIVGVSEEAVESAVRTNTDSAIRSNSIRTAI